MPGGGEISITTRLEINDFTISIKDSGPGIAEENIPKLFSPFFTTKPVGKGTGLGLPVCYGIVKMHGGSIQTENNKDGGAVFTVRINCRAKEGHRLPNILIVDDDVDLLERSKIRGEALLELIRDLLFLNKRDSGKVEKSIESLDLKEILAGHLDFLRSRLTGLI